MFTRDRVKPLISLAAGALLTLAFAPFGWFWLAPLSYASLFLLWQHATPGRAFWLGWLFGCASFLGGIHWIYVSVHGFGGVPMVPAALMTGGFVAAMSLYIGAVGWMASRWFETSGLGAWLVALPALWVLVEWWRGWFLTGLGWLSAGYTQSETWLSGYAPVTGVHGVSWAVMICAGALVAFVRGSPRERSRAAVALIVVLGLAFTLKDVRWTEPKSDFVTVALVQGAVRQDLKWLPEQLPVTLELYRRLTAEAHGSQLIVLPEVAIPALYSTVQDYLQSLEDAAAAAGSTVMVGALRYDQPTGTAQNALFALGDSDAVYIKRHLVPYGEYFPVPGFIRTWLRWVPNSDTAPGEPRQAPLELIGERIAVTICYEDVFGSEQLAFPEATLLVNVSNDAWFGDSIAAQQHLQIAQLRAAEAGRYLVRSTNTGVSAVIDPFGRVTERLPQFEPGVLRATVQGFTGATPYFRWGNYLVVLSALAALTIQSLMTKLTIRPGT